MTTDNHSTPAPAAIILAAGKGTRMGGDRPKVLFEVAGRPLVWWVVQACKRAGAKPCVLVVGYKADDVKQALADEPDCRFVLQTEQLGTGHATKMAAPLFEGQPATDVFVLAGDGPLIRPETLDHLLDIHRTTGAAATLATAVLDNPDGYGRVVRDEAGGFRAIVEQKDATADQLKIREVNPSYYCFRGDALFSALNQVRNDNRQGEYYLTDVPALLHQRGLTVTVVEAVPAQDVLSVNTPEQLAEVDEILRSRERR